ncbi:MAG TPA: hypothetical protein VFM49_29345 [Chloroflexia bacterium]|nr:hypothetical protein [Chloroflexia bacterium]
MTIASRPAGMLVGLFLAVLVVSAVVNLLPAEWQESLITVPAIALWRGGLAPRDGAAVAARTPQAGSSADRPDLPPRDTGRRGFGPFGISRASVGGFTLHLTSLITLLCGGLLILYLLPARIGRIAAAMRGPWPARVGLGLLGLAAAVILVALGLVIGVALGGASLITILGVPIWLAITAIGPVAALLGLTAVSLPLGRWTGRRLGLAEQPPQVDLLAGLLVLFLVSLVPVLGGLVLLCAALLGLGAVLQTRAGSARPWAFRLPDLEY